MNSTFIDPGLLRTELALEQCAEMPDGLGGHVEAWGEIATLFARVEPVRAESRHGADQSLETVTHRITLRWRTDIASGMRLTRLGRVFTVVTVHDPDDSRRYLVCRAKEEGL